MAKAVDDFEKAGALQQQLTGERKKLLAELDGKKEQIRNVK